MRRTLTVTAADGALIDLPQHLIDEGVRVMKVAATFTALALVSTLLGVSTIALGILALLGHANWNTVIGFLLLSFGLRLISSIGLRRARKQMEDLARRANDYATNLR